MPKRVIITEEQLKTIQNDVLSLFPFISDEIKNHANSILNETLLKKLLNKRFAELRAAFSDDIMEYDERKIQNELSRLMALCQKKERPIRDNLEKICYNTLLENFDIPNDVVKLQCSLCDVISGAVTPVSCIIGDREYDSVEQINNEEQIRVKAEILFLIVVGAAIRLCEASKKFYLNDIFDLDETLCHLYSRIIKINEYLTFTKKDVNITDDNRCEAGDVTVRLGDDTVMTDIKSRGLIFPIVLTETLKGFMELFAAHGMSETPDIINDVFTLQNELWAMKVGPVLWDMVVGQIENFDAKEIPYLITNISEMNCEEFNGLFKEILYKTKKAKVLLKNIRNQYRHDLGYDDFLNDVLTKQTNFMVSEEDDF